jgi:hypothetical protein
MASPLELVYEYRHLMGKCQAGLGLTMDEVEVVEAIENLFRRGSIEFDRSGHSNGDGNGKGKVAATRSTATLRGGPHKLWDKVELVSGYLDHFVVQVTAFTEPGVVIELLVEDEERRLSYRFKTCVVSVAEELNQTGQQVVLEIIGAPLLVRRGPRRPRSDHKSLPPRPSSEPRVVAA